MKSVGMNDDLANDAGLVIALAAQGNIEHLLSDVQMRSAIDSLNNFTSAEIKEWISYGKKVAKRI